MIEKDVIILLRHDFLCGAFYYAIEYLDYLLKNNIDTYLILDSFFKSNHKFLIADKYDLNKLYPNFFKRILINNKIIKTDKLIILDGTSIQKLYTSKIIYNKLFYNYGDYYDSLKKPFKKNKKIITFGDKELGCKVDYHFPLCLNYDIFKTYDNFEDKIREENKKELKYFVAKHRTIKDFHKTFNKLYYGDNGNIWERANRIIPECKFYNKEIIFKPNDSFDSAQLRYERSYDYYNIWKFRSPDTNPKNLTFAEFIQKY